MVNNTLQTLLILRQEMFEARHASGELDYVDIHMIISKYIEIEKDNPQNINELKQKMGLSYYNK